MKGNAMPNRFDHKPFGHHFPQKPNRRRDHDHNGNGHGHGNDHRHPRPSCEPHRPRHGHC